MNNHKKDLTIVVILLIIIASSLQAQSIIQGTVYDRQKNEALYFAKVRKSNSNNGVITNKDGFFKISANLSDSLILTHPLYSKLIVPVSFFQNQDTLFVNQIIHNIPEMIAYGIKDEVYHLIISSRKKLLNSKDFESKAYLSVESYSNDVPLEIIQSYYNAHVTSEGIGELLLKNGRIGLNTMTDHRFVSLNSTKILLQYPLFHTKKTQVMPLSPLQLNKRHLKKNYKVELVAVENGLHIFHLIPRDTNGQDEFFEAFLYIDKIKQEIHRLELTKQKLNKQPFVSINPQDKIDSLNVYLTYNFSGPFGGLYNLEMKYDFIYQNPLVKRNISTFCNLIFYDSLSLFELPLGGYNTVNFSDYEKIIYQPFNSIFWVNNSLISPSSKDLENEKFFHQNGVLLNFDSLKSDHELFENKITFWDGQRIFLNQINGEFNYNVNNSTLLDYHNMTTLSDHYNLEASIFLDFCNSKDSTKYLIKTLINLEESYFYLQKNKNTTCLINSYFDLVEIYKRRLEEQLLERNLSREQVDSLYLDVNQNMRSALKLFLKEVELGKNETAIQKYIQLIRKELGIDNSLLIEREELHVTVNQEDATEKNEYIDRYNYGSALLKIGRYEDALKILKEAEDLGDEHPCLFYNLGVCFLKFEEIEMACHYFQKSGSLGENLEEEIKKICFTD